MGDGRCGDGRLASGAHTLPFPPRCAGEGKSSRCQLGLMTFVDFLIFFGVLSYRLFLSYLSLCPRFCWMCFSFSFFYICSALSHVVRSVLSSTCMLCLPKYQYQCSMSMSTRNALSSSKRLCIIIAPMSVESSFLPKRSAIFTLSLLVRVWCACWRGCFGRERAPDRMLGCVY